MKIKKKQSPQFEQCVKALKEKRETEKKTKFVYGEGFSNPELHQNWMC
jgi:hypothetical protein